MPAMVMVILTVVSLMVLSVFAEIRPLPREEYDKAARQKVLSAYHQTGSLPSSAVVFGRAVTVPAGSVSVDRQRKVAFDVLDWRRAMVEQALINTCITMMARCGKMMPCDAFMKLCVGYRVKNLREDPDVRARPVRRTANSQDVPRDGSIDWDRFEQLASDETRQSMFSPTM